MPPLVQGRADAGGICKYVLLMGTAKGKATPETTELFWGDEADNAIQSRGSIFQSGMGHANLPNSSESPYGSAVSFSEPFPGPLLHNSPLILGPNPEPAHVEDKSTDLRLSSETLRSEFHLEPPAYRFVHELVGNINNVLLESGLVQKAEGSFPVSPIKSGTSVDFPMVKRGLASFPASF
ncbi:hypothetical protein BTVI_136370 [Pitangus sulphuratus]|nr:hypothetical protein BTVI_136370 [Pitangus sulphuratus]